MPVTVREAACGYGAIRAPGDDCCGTAKLGDIYRPETQGIVMCRRPSGRRGSIDQLTLTGRLCLCSLRPARHIMHLGKPLHTFTPPAFTRPAFCGLPVPVHGPHRHKAHAATHGRLLVTVTRSLQFHCTSWGPLVLRCSPGQSMLLCTAAWRPLSARYIDARHQALMRDSLPSIT